MKRLARAATSLVVSSIDHVALSSKGRRERRPRSGRQFGLGELRRLKEGVTVSR